MTRFISAFQFKKFGNWDWATNSIALLLAKRTRSRDALAPTLSLPACVVTLKTGEVLPYVSGHRKCGGEFRGNGAARHEVFARVGVVGRRWWSGHQAFGFGAATVFHDVLLGAVKGEKQRDWVARIQIPRSDKI